jgi:hypothetical protein
VSLTSFLDVDVPAIAGAPLVLVTLLSLTSLLSTTIAERPAGVGVLDCWHPAVAGDPAVANFPLKVTSLPCCTCVRAIVDVFGHWNVYLLYVSLMVLVNFQDF